MYAWLVAVVVGTWELVIVRVVTVYWQDGGVVSGINVERRLVQLEVRDNESRLFSFPISMAPAIFGPNFKEIAT